jgi:hypothetical protein
MAGKKMAVLIGINNYENCGLLNYAIQDVEALRDILIDPQRGGYQSEYVKTLIDKESPHPHRANILNMIGNITRGANAEDSILMYFAGHGLTLDNEPCILPIDAYPNNAKTCIPIKDLQEQVEHSAANIRLMIFDACHSGLEMGRPASGFMTSRFEAALQSMSESGGIAVLSSCKADQVSLEDKDLAHGVFSYYLTEGRRGPADTDKDYDISVLDAYNYVLSNVREWTLKNNKQQTPTLYAKMAGEIRLVTVPKPSSHEAKTGIAVVSKVTLQKVVRGDTSDIYEDSDSYSKKRESTKEECAKSIGKMGAFFAKLYGPEEIKATDSMNLSYPRGQFGGGIFSDGSVFGYRLYIGASPDLLEGKTFLTEVMTEFDFDFLELELQSPINLAKLYRLTEVSGLKATGFSPPVEMSAGKESEPRCSMHVKNYTGGATITFTIWGRESLRLAISLIRTALSASQ